jgi:cytochrome c5
MRIIINFITTESAPLRHRFTPPFTLLPLVAAAILLAVGCATPVPALGPDDAARASVEWPGTTVETLARGRSTYLDHCTSCHAAFRPDTKPAAAWRPIVEKMANRSKLDRRSTEEVIRYLVASSRR